MKLNYVHGIQEKSILRKKYLDSLNEPQEYFIEQLIKGASTYKFERDNETLGYCIVSEGNTILEFYVENNCLFEKEKIFTHMIKKLEISSAYCKSFDHMLMNLCMQFIKEQVVVGYLFKEYNENFKDKGLSVKPRVGLKSDLSAISSINDDFFIDEKEIEHYIQNNDLIIFENENELVGCGLLQRVIGNKDYYDIGMLVNPSFRKRG